MRHGEDPAYDSNANWGTAQGDVDWAWIDERLAAFATPRGLWWGRTGFDGVLHAITWQSGGLRRMAAVAPAGGMVVVTISADYRDDAGRWHSRSERVEVPRAAFADGSDDVLERAIADCDSWGADDVPVARP